MKEKMGRLDGPYFLFSAVTFLCLYVNKIVYILLHLEPDKDKPPTGST